jgi:hypothetical protein
MSMQQHEYTELPEHVRRIIAREGELEFTPPSFERWLGRLQMFRTMSSMGAFSLVWLVSYTAGASWEDATLRGIVAAIAFHFLAWAAGLFIFGELYDAEVRAARRTLEEKERERARRIESYYRDRLRAQQAGDVDESPAPPAAGSVHSLGDPLQQAIPGYVPSNTGASSIAA